MIDKNKKKIRNIFKLILTLVLPISMETLTTVSSSNFNRNMFIVRENSMIFQVCQR
jgi:hypothetical protein